MNCFSANPFFRRFRKSSIRSQLTINCFEISCTNNRPFVSSRFFQNIFLSIYRFFLSPHIHARIYICMHDFRIVERNNMHEELLSIKKKSSILIYKKVCIYSRIFVEHFLNV